MDEFPISTSTVHDVLIPFYSSYWGVSELLMDSIVQCESKYQNTTVNYNPPREISVGLVQINLLAHKNIAKHTAMNSFFSLNFLGEALSKGQISMWLGSKACWSPLAYTGG